MSNSSKSPSDMDASVETLLEESVSSESESELSISSPASNGTSGKMGS